MVDTVDVHYIYPPNFEDAPNVTDKEGWREVCVQLTGVSDGTGETDVTKVDISTLRCSNGAVPTRTAIMEIAYSLDGMTAVLEWDRAPNSLIARLSGEGHMDWRNEGGKVDPSSAGDRTGDILLTSGGTDSGDTYEITLWIKLKES